MEDPSTPRHVEIKDESDQVVAEAQVTTDDGPEGTVRAVMHPSSAPVPPGVRASLADAVMDLPEVQASDRMEATIPYGDGESVERLRERTEDLAARTAGATILLSANVPSGRSPGGELMADDQVTDEPLTDGQQPGSE